MDRGAWQTTVHGVAKSQTQWKRLNTHARTSYVNLPEGRLLPTLDKLHVQSSIHHTHCVLFVYPWNFNGVLPEALYFERFFSGCMFHQYLMVRHRMTRSYIGCK